MTITPTILTRAAGVAAAAAGAIFIGVQINHPHLDATSIQTTEMAIRDTFKVVMAALALAGITGMYVSQVRRNGLLGLLGYLLLGAGYLLVLGTAFVAAFVMPSVAALHPEYANDVIAATTGGTPVGDIGTLAAVAKVQGFAYLAGGLLFGIALFRARVLARWASVLLAVGGLVSAALSMMPDAFYRLLAFPNGIAMIGLGASLWLTRPGGLHHRDHHVARRRGPGPMSTRRGWPVPTALVLLSAIPLTAGTLRLIQLAGGPAILPADARFAGFPVALVAHIVGSAAFALGGSLQFVPRLRTHHRAWHRRAGRMVAVAGLVVAGSAMWLTLGYPAQPGTGDVLYLLRLLVASAMAACLVLGFAAVHRRDIAAHRAWMIRAFALGLGAGTQVFTEGVGDALVGTGDVRGDLAKAAGWAINLAVAEWVIRRPARRRSQSRTAARTARSTASAGARS